MQYKFLFLILSDATARYQGGQKKWDKWNMPAVFTGKDS